ncbi:hypothetical protein BDF20DRAFT_838801 [Mycotypha africana]|uniref:uncharacterized protein n=1 Tax=Mycotypha africana TaxID=64632 RepID=UPI00230152F8|nr:uncharacterized protein BDF20DRAFT_838801 [Mycotypha africana]KAI8970443.1 hypothetical protein BDF20DRAFT_838801 [Mycotypha africana]
MQKSLMLLAFSYNGFFAFFCSDDLHRFEEKKNVLSTTTMPTTHNATSAAQTLHDIRIKYLILSFTDAVSDNSFNSTKSSIYPMERRDEHLCDSSLTIVTEENKQQHKHLLSTEPSKEVLLDGRSMISEDEYLVNDIDDDNDQNFEWDQTSDEEDDSGFLHRAASSSTEKECRRFFRQARTAYNKYCCWNYLSHFMKQVIIAVIGSSLFTTAAVCVNIFSPCPTFQYEVDPNFTNIRSNDQILLYWAAFMWGFSWITIFTIEAIPIVVSKWCKTFLSHRSEQVKTNMEYYMNLKWYIGFLIITAWNWGAWAFLTAVPFSSFCWFKKQPLFETGLAKQRIVIMLHLLEQKSEIRSSNLIYKLQKNLKKVIINEQKSCNRGGKHGKDINSDEYARKNAKKLYISLAYPDGTVLPEDKEVRRCLLLSDFEPYFKTAQEARDAFAIFDRDSNGDITRREFRDTVLHIYRKRKDIAVSMRNTTQALGKIDLMLLCVSFFALLLIACGFFPNQLMAGTCSHRFIVISFDICFWQYRQESLKARRFGSMSEITQFNIDFCTTTEQFWELHDRLNVWVTCQSRDFGSDFDLRCEEIIDVNDLILKVWLPHKGNWQDIMKRFQRKTRFMLALKDIMTELGIRYELPTQRFTSAVLPPDDKTPVFGNPHLMRSTPQSSNSEQQQQQQQSAFPLAQDSKEQQIYKEIKQARLSSSNAHNSIRHTGHVAS